MSIEIGRDEGVVRRAATELAGLWSLEALEGEAAEHRFDAPCRVAGYLEEPAEIESVVAQIRGLEREIGLQRSIAIGGLILKRFFGGSAELWRMRSKKKNNSVRRIARHPRCPLSKSSLSEAIGVYVVVDQLPFVRSSDHLGTSHVAAVLRLDLESQEYWLKRAEQHRWSVRELRAEIRKRRAMTTPDRHDGRAHPSVRLLSRAVRAIDRAVSATLRSDELSARDVARISELSCEIEEIQAKLGNLAGGQERGLDPREGSAVEAGAERQRLGSVVASVGYTVE